MGGGYFALYKCKGLRAGSNNRNKETVSYTQFKKINLTTAPQLKENSKTVHARIYKIHFARKNGRSKKKLQAKAS